MSLKSICLITCIFCTGLSRAQLNQHTEYRSEGNYIRAYHANGNLSTEVFNPANARVFRFGFARAFNPEGRKIYERNTSNTGMSATVSFSYYTTGALQTAVYRTQPEGSADYEIETTSFDQNGIITGVQKERHHEHHVPPHPHTGTRHRPDHSPIDRDSLDFFRTWRPVDPTGYLITEKSAFPADGYAQTEWKTGSRVTRSRIEFFRKQGIQCIDRVFYDNGRLHEETIYEDKVRHYRMWDEEGFLVKEEYNRAME